MNDAIVLIGIDFISDTFARVKYVLGGVYHEADYEFTPSVVPGAPDHVYTEFLAFFTAQIAHDHDEEVAAREDAAQTRAVA